jgi:hypothetical protein
VFIKHRYRHFKNFKCAHKKDLKTESPWCWLTKKLPSQERANHVSDDTGQESLGRNDFGGLTTVVFLGVSMVFRSLWDVKNFGELKTPQNTREV